ncbi:MAG: hypothetical protein HRT36_02230 [Alphaproteobacteria bacterium]|nr:hypothetical protein [Alphaproteobacteria bacterium]
MIAKTPEDAPEQNDTEEGAIEEPADARNADAAANVSGRLVADHVTAMFGKMMDCTRKSVILHSLSLVVLGVALLSIDYWRGGVTEFLSSVIGPPAATIDVGDIILLQSELQNFTVRQQQLEEHTGTLQQTVTQITEERQTVRAQQEASEAQIVTLHGNLKDVREQISSQEIITDALQQQSQSPEEFLVSPETQDFLIRMNSELAQLQQRLQQVAGEQEKIQQGLANVQYWAALDTRLEQVAVAFEAAEPFAEELMALRLHLRVADRALLAFALETLNGFAAVGVPDIIQWSDASTHVLEQRFASSVLNQATPNEQSWLQQVWQEVRGLVKISKLREDILPADTLHELQQQLDEVAEQLPENQAVQQLRQQGVQIVASHAALQDIVDWLDAQWISMGVQ